jgi:hypothetical protein
LAALISSNFGQVQGLEIAPPREELVNGFERFDDPPERGRQGLQRAVLVCKHGVATHRRQFLRMQHRRGRRPGRKRKVGVPALTGCAGGRLRACAWIAREHHQLGMIRVTKVDERVVINLPKAFSKSNVLEGADRLVSEKKDLMLEP